MSNAALAETFFKDWDAGKTQFTIRSSGSTGAPKDILLKRQWMEWSARGTAAFLNPRPSDKLFCCLPLNKVGGLMMLVRSRVWQIPAIVSEPSSNPLLQAVDADIISLTPHQLSRILADKISRLHLSRFREVLIGGSDLPTQLEQQILLEKGSTQFRHSYGMSETYSHIAIRNINGPEQSVCFKCLEGVNVRQSEDGCAEISTPFTNGYLKTNDAIELDSEGRFRVLGRKDFAINSGGVKLFPEQIEQAISQHLQPINDFVISSLSDAVFGEIPVLVCTNRKAFEELDYSFLKAINAYALPKHIIEIQEIPLNEGGKPDRIKIKTLINR